MTCAPIGGVAVSAVYVRTAPSITVSWVASYARLRISAARGRSANFCAQTEVPRTSRSANRTTEILTSVVFCISHSRIGLHCAGSVIRSLCRTSGLQVTPDSKNPFVPEKLHRFFGRCAAFPFSRWLHPQKVLPGKRGRVLYVERGRTPYRGDGMCQEACEKARSKKASEPEPQEFQKKIRFAGVASL